MPLRKTILVLIVSMFMYAVPSTAQAKTEALPGPLKIGVSLPISQVTGEAMTYAKSVGISSVQLGVNEWFDKSGHFKLSDHEITREVKRASKAASKAGIVIGSIHMPYGQHIDLSVLDDTERERIVALHKKVLGFCRPLKPRVILFHPSWFLSLNHREQHISQLVRSVHELEQPVRKLGATMVIENMTGPKLYVVSHGVKYERPLCRTVPEMMEIMEKLPPTVYAAVDLNHILHPEKMILALGHRLKFIHVADGDGAHELHYYPCSGKGMNDWMAILDALYQAGYQGPFMYECHYKDLRDLVYCYHELYNQYILEKYIKPNYK